jgi:hypothetical protein
VGCSQNPVDSPLDEGGLQARAAEQLLLFVLRRSFAHIIGARVIRSIVVILLA